MATDEEIGYKAIEVRRLESILQELGEAEAELAKCHIAFQGGVKIKSEETGSHAVRRFLRIPI